MAEQIPPPIRKRILMFYFAAGMQLVMGGIVAAAGPGLLSGFLVAAIVLGCLGFAYANVRLAKLLRQKWEAQVRERAAAQSVNE